MSDSASTPMTPWGMEAAKEAQLGRDLRLFISLAIGVLAVLLTLFTRPRRPGPVSESARIYRLPASLPELSGLTRASPESGGYMWGHNDSMGAAELTLLNTKGERLSQVPVIGAENIDWEDMSRDSQGFLYLADTGNNFHWRKHLSIYQLRPQLDQGVQTLQVTRRLNLCYPARSPQMRPLLGGASQREISSPLEPLRCRNAGVPWDNEERRLDSEALFWAPSFNERPASLYLFDKAYLGGEAILYALPPPPRWPSRDRDQPSVVLQPLALAELGLPHPPTAGRVTGASLSPNHRCLAVLSYRLLSLFPWPPQSPWRPLEQQRIPRGLRQVEAVEWVEQGRLWVGGEARQFAVFDGFHSSGVCGASR